MFFLGHAHEMQNSEQVCCESRMVTIERTLTLDCLPFCDKVHEC